MVNGFPVCPQVFPVYHCTQCLLRKALFSDTAIPSAVDFSRVLFQRHDVSCDLKCPGNTSLLLSAQGLLTNGVTNTSWWSHSKFFLSKSNKQCGTEAPTAFLPISSIFWGQQRGQISSCAVPTHELCCFGLRKVSLILLALRRWSVFFLDKPDGSNSQQAWGPELPGGQMWFNLDKCFETNSWLSFRIIELTGSCHPHRRMMSGAG